jgi:hypothetical protein
MANRFSIKSEHFSLYQAFREEAEKVGWIYNTDFNEFMESKMDACNCLFFCTEWKHKGRDPRFAFSNSSTRVFHLPEQWNEALEYMTKAYNPENQSSKLTLSLKNLADHYGVKAEDIIITV